MPYFTVNNDMWWLQTLKRRIYSSFLLWFHSNNTSMTWVSMKTNAYECTIINSVQPWFHDSQQINHQMDTLLKPLIDSVIKMIWIIMMRGYHLQHQDFDSSQHSNNHIRKSALPPAIAYSNSSTLFRRMLQPNENPTY